MSKTHTSKPRRRPDGSIDVAYHMAVGRQCRSGHAYRLLFTAKALFQTMRVRHLRTLFGMGTHLKAE